MHLYPPSSKGAHFSTYRHPPRIDIPFYRHTSFVASCILVFIFILFFIFLFIFFLFYTRLVACCSHTVAINHTIMRTYAYSCNKSLTRARVNAHLYTRQRTPLKHKPLDAAQSACHNAVFNFICIFISYNYLENTHKRLDARAVSAQSACHILFF